MKEWIQLQVTFPTREEARRVAQDLVQKRLAACVQIAGSIESFYRWKGKQEQENEILLLAKTSSKLFDEICQSIQSVHSYECPQIVALPIFYLAKDYQDWLENQLKPESP